MSFVLRTSAGLARRMERALYAEEVARANGLLQRLDPRVKVGGLFALIIGVALAHRLAVIAFVFAVALVMALLSRVPLRTLAARVWLGALLFTGFIALPSLFLTPGQVVYQLPVLNWGVTAQGLRSALYLISRVETTVTLSLLLVLTTLWTHVLKALRVLGVPVTVIVILMMTHRYIYLMLQTAQDMFESRASRAVGRLSGAESRRVAVASVGVLLSKTIHLSGEVYLAMQARGFHGEAHTIDDFKMQARDWIALGFFLSLTACIIRFGR